MYAVIFKAKIKTLDPTYQSTADRLRELALQEYGCLEFTSTAEGSREIAISYWPSKDIPRKAFKKSRFTAFAVR
ncbi:MAG: hypothetical protein QF863_07885 [Pseudomonadales bacterium]|jgi:hypothetical protein|nr:hypothetical protein [Pseudomonadales bacterium]